MPGGTHGKYCAFEHIHTCYKSWHRERDIKITVIDWWFMSFIIGIPAEPTYMDIFHVSTLHILININIAHLPFITVSTFLGSTEHFFFLF